MQVFGGGDPGKTGAICMLFQNTLAEHIAFIDMKEHPKDIYYKLASISSGYDVSIVLEKLHGLYRKSVKATFGLGRQVERMELLLIIAGLKYTLLTPKEWQNKINVIRSKQTTAKEDTLTLCKKTYPQYQHLLYGPKGGLLDGRVDALMMAHCAKLIYGEHK